MVKINLTPALSWNQEREKTVDGEGEKIALSGNQTELSYMIPTKKVGNVM